MDRRKMDPEIVINITDVLFLRPAWVSPIEKAAADRPFHDLRHASGKFGAVADMSVEVARAHEALPSLLDAFGDRMELLRRVYVQNIAVAAEEKSVVDLVPLHEIERQMQAAIAETYARALSLGKRAAADLTSATEDQKRNLAALCRDEYGYLSGFCGAMRDGAGRMPYDERMQWYTLAAREAFWMGWVMARPASLHRMITWHYGDTLAHCAQCLKFGAHGPYSIEEFRSDVLDKGFLPQSGRLECRGRHCRCWLSDNSSIDQSSPDWIPTTAAGEPSTGGGGNDAAA
jgi:hypothetical protein